MKCKTCTETDMDMFYKNKSMKSGYMNQCKRCILGPSSEYHDVPVQRKQEMQEEQDEFAKEYVKKHPVSKWDDDMVLCLFTAMRIIEKDFSTNQLTKVMQDMCSGLKEDRRKKRGCNITIEQWENIMVKRFVHEKIYTKKTIEERR